MINPTVSAATSGLFSTTLMNAAELTLMVATSGGALAGTETVKVEYTTDGGATWMEAKRDGAVLQLDVNNNHLTIYGPGTFRAVKSVTVAAVGVRAIV